MRIRVNPLAILLLPPALIACNEAAPAGVFAPQADQRAVALHAQSSEFNMAIAELRRATARYHNPDNATADGFVELHGCEELDGEDPVGVVFINFGRVADGIIDPSLPEALIYEPTEDGRLKLAGAELVIPHALWTAEDPPEFLGAQFHSEDDFFTLHVWIWRHNPSGMFAIGNSRVQCDIEA
jgi:hypothetical protein